MLASLAENLVKRKKQPVRSNTFWLKINTCFLCCFEATIAYTISPLAAVPSTPITTTAVWKCSAEPRDDDDDVIVLPVPVPNATGVTVEKSSTVSHSCVIIALKSNAAVL